MKFQYNSCINCPRTWDPKDRRASDWHRVYDHTCQRWLCYRCAERIWKQAKTGFECPKEIEDALRVVEFRSDVQALLELHKRDHQDMEDSDVEIANL